MCGKMDEIKPPVVEPLIRLTSKTTSWASLSVSSRSEHASISDLDSQYVSGEKTNEDGFYLSQRKEQDLISISDRDSQYVSVEKKSENGFYLKSQRKEPDLISISDLDSQYVVEKKNENGFYLKSLSEESSEEDNYYKIKEDNFQSIDLYRGDFSYQKTVVYENGLRLIKGSYFPGRKFDSLDCKRNFENYYSKTNSLDSGMFLDDRRSDRTATTSTGVEMDFSVCSDFCVEEPGYSVPCSRPIEVSECPSLPFTPYQMLENDSSNSEKSATQSDKLLHDNPIYMELEPPKPLERSSNSLKSCCKDTKCSVRTGIRKVTSSAEKRMLCVEKTNREVFEKPCPIRMVYRRHSQRRLMSRKRVERIVPRLTQLCVQVLIEQVGY